MILNGGLTMKEVTFETPDDIIEWYRKQNEGDDANE